MLAQEYEINSKEHVYEYDRDGEKKYLRIEKITDEQSVLFYVTDISLWWNEIRHAKKQSGVDELTGLYNRRGFYEKIEALFVDPSSCKYAVMLMIDADNLKKINDTLGHYMGDQYLCAIAKTLQEVSGENAVCARLGGDEFAVFVYGYPSMGALEKLILNIKSSRGKAFFKMQNANSYTLQFSVGSAFYPMDGQDFHLLMRIADENMYVDKKLRKVQR